MLLSTAAFFLLVNLPHFRRERTGQEDALAHSDVHWDPVDAGRENARVDKPPAGPEAAPAPSGRGFHLLLLLQAAVCFVSNGAFPSIQTYSCLPYGNAVYHLSATLHALSNPLAAFLAFFLPCRDRFKIFSTAAAGSIFAAFILGAALRSPGMLWGQDLGGAATVRRTTCEASVLQPFFLRRGWVKLVLLIRHFQLLFGDHPPGKSVILEPLV